MLINLLQKKLIRSQRYRIVYRLGFFFYLLYSNHKTLLFSLFKKGSLFGVFFSTVFSFCDFFSKEFFVLLESYYLNLCKTALDFLQQEKKSIQIFYNRVPKFTSNAVLLPKTTVCLTTASASILTNCFSFLLAHKENNFQFKYFWISSFCIVLNPKHCLLSKLSNLFYLRFFSTFSFLEKIKASCFFSKLRFMFMLLIFLKLSFNFLLCFTFLTKQLSLQRDYT
jgi:hypothetical protein